MARVPDRLTQSDWWMPHRAIIIVCVLYATVAVPSHLRAQSTSWRLAAVTITGARTLEQPLLDSAVHSIVPSLPAVFTSQSALRLAAQGIESALSRTYALSGYYRMRVDSLTLRAVDLDSSHGFRLTLYVNERKSYRLGTLRFVGDTNQLSRTFTSHFETRTDAILDEPLLEADIRDALKQCELLGYPFATINIASIIPIDTGSASGTIDLTLSIHLGARARIGKIVITGNRLTSTDVIVRELRIPIGAYYDVGEVTRARNRIERLGFFESVSEPTLYLIDDSTIALTITVKEASTSSIDGVLGYNPGRTASESGYINGFLDLGFSNISGTGRNGTLHYDRTTQTSQQLEVRYLEPWILHYPLNALVHFLERQQDSTYVQTDLGAELRLLFTEDITLTGSIAMTHIVPSDVPDAGFVTFDSRTITTGLGGAIDTRDNLVAPRHGVLAALGASYGSKSVYGPVRFLTSTTGTTIGITRLSIDVSVYTPFVGDRFIAAIGVHAFDIHAAGDSLDASDLVRLGGIRSLRGYREDDFLVSRYAYTNLELRAMTGRASFLFVFTDVGYLLRDAVRGLVVEQTVTPVSYGFGAQVDSPLGILSVSIGLAKSEPIDQAKLHFGLIKAF